MKKPNAWGTAVAVFGLASILAALILEEAFTPRNHAAIISLKFVEHVGIALMILGLVGIIVDFDDWRRYFQSRLAETIVKRDYLGTLDKDALLSLQTDTLKAFFKGDDIDRKGSFLEYFYTRIRGFIGSPYREDTHAIMNIAYIASKDLLEVEDTISYKCRKVGDFIQENITWLNEPGEIKEVLAFKVTIQIPKTLFQSKEFKIRYPEATEHTIVFENPNKNLEPEADGLGYKLSLKDYRGIDELKVRIHARYLVERNRFIIWKMTYPSNRLMLVIKYPPELDFSIESFGILPDDLDEEHKDGFHSVRYDSWLLPHNGFVFQFKDRGTREHPPTPS